MCVEAELEGREVQEVGQAREKGLGRVGGQVDGRSSLSNGELAKQGEPVFPLRLDRLPRAFVHRPASLKASESLLHQHPVILHLKTPNPEPLNPAGLKPVQHLAIGRQ